MNIKLNERHTMLNNRESLVETDWRIAAATARGPSHDRTGDPNQDSFEIRTSPDGRVVVVVVSDGAGSAERSDEGSSTCVKIMSQWLLDIGMNRQADIARTLTHDNQAGQSLLELIAQGLEHVRISLKHTGSDLRLYAHTFTGVLISPVGGLVVQIGDSPVVLARSSRVIGDDREPGVDHFAESRILIPEKGEYANETHFVTQDDWLVRLQPVTLNPDRFDTFMIMSDGAGDLVINRKEIFKPLAGSLMKQLVQARDGYARDTLIEALITDPRCDEVTSDDKTLVVMFSRHLDSLDSRSTSTSTSTSVSPSSEPQHESSAPSKMSIKAQGDLWSCWQSIPLLALGIILGGVLTWNIINTDENGLNSNPVVLHNPEVFIPDCSPIPVVVPQMDTNVQNVKKSLDIIIVLEYIQKAHNQAQAYMEQAKILKEESLGKFSELNQKDRNIHNAEIEETKIKAAKLAGLAHAEAEKARYIAEVLVDFPDHNEKAINLSSRAQNHAIKTDEYAKAISKIFDRPKKLSSTNKPKPPSDHGSTTINTQPSVSPSPIEHPSPPIKSKIEPQKFPSKNDGNKNNIPSAEPATSREYNENVQSTSAPSSEQPPKPGNVDEKHSQDITTVPSTFPATVDN